MNMIKIIKGKRYNTDTADALLSLRCRADSSRDFSYEETWLYRTPKGAWFLAGHGGPMSRWAAPSGKTGRTGGEGIIPIDADYAQELLEQHDKHDLVEQYFADKLVDA